MQAISDMPRVIVIGASFGGVAALLELLARLPAGLPAIVGVVLHVGNQRSILPELLAPRTKLPATHARNGEPLVPGRIYIAPPDHHMLFTPQGVQLNRGPLENHARPAIDPLFRSAALHWRDRAIGVVLTGFLDDGTAGLAAIKRCGGTAIVQDPATAQEPSMPASAMANVDVDHCEPIERIAGVLAREVQAPDGAGGSADAGMEREHAVFEGINPMENLEAVAERSIFSCPDCGGGLWEINDKRPLRYRCHTGHAFSVRTLENLQAESTEYAMWSSVRSLQEREFLLRRLASVSRSTGDNHQADAGLREADRLRDQVRALTDMIEEQTSGA